MVQDDVCAGDDDDADEDNRISGRHKMSNGRCSIRTIDRNWIA